MTSLHQKKSCSHEQDFFLSILIGFLHLQAWSQNADADTTYAKQGLAKGVDPKSITQIINEEFKEALIISEM